jgi:hypothetical protein
MPEAGPRFAFYSGMTRESLQHQLVVTPAHGPLTTVERSRWVPFVGLATRRWARLLVLAGVFASLASNVAGQSQSGQLGVSVTVVRSCSVNINTVSWKGDRAWVGCGASAQPAARIETLTAGTPNIETALPLAGRADCPTCRLLVVNF